MGKQQSYRGERLGEEIRRIISEMLTRELKDPVFDGMISVSYVKSTYDGSFATVYFTSLAADDAEVKAGFEKAKGFIRNEISRRLGIRRAPDLRFKVDDAERYGQHIDELLDSLDLPKVQEKSAKQIDFPELLEIIDGYERYFVFTHVHMDGDTLGAAVAFAGMMREIGREAWVVVNEEIPRTLEIIRESCVVGFDDAVSLGWRKTSEDEGEIIPPYLAITMDFASVERLEGREFLFEGAAETLSIDHHAVTDFGCDYNYIDSKAAAASEIIYRLLKFAKLPLTERIAAALYVGIVTDTGRFQYANTTPETHRIAADLLEAGADFGAVYRDIYQSVKAEKLFVQNEMLNTLDIFGNGQAAMAFLRADTLARFNASEDETDGLSEVLRSIIGVEVGVFAKECQNGKIKVSMRSKSWFDVAALAAEFGGGGHILAAGFTSADSLEDVCAILKEKLEARLK